MSLKVKFFEFFSLENEEDVKILNDNDYKIKNSVMVDMFPHTPHIETVMLLSK